MRLDLSGDQWTTKAWIPNEWRIKSSAELGKELTGRTNWIPARVPGSVHRDLQAAGLIPDPFVALNSLQCEWISQRDWMYQRSFRLPHEAMGKPAFLTLEGVDYQADVFLNGHYMGRTENTYVRSVFEVTGAVQAGDNELQVVILAAPQEYGQIGWTSTVRHFKPRFVYDWDFSTRLIHLGFWKGITLDIVEAATFDRVRLSPTLEEQHGAVRVDFRLRIAYPMGLKVAWTVRRDDQEIASGVEKVQQPGPRGEHTFFIKIENPERWFPNGLGDQPLYEVELKLQSEESDCLDSFSQKTGFRELEFVTWDNDPPNACPYHCVANGVPVFIRGWNWCPIDILYGGVGGERYRQLLTGFKEAGANMVRVWGGGLIETDAFFNLCDELGLMVWHDFPQSSSGLENIPNSDPHYLEQLKAIVMQAVQDHSHHPAMAIWCGGNELTEADITPVNMVNPNIAAIRQAMEEARSPHLLIPSTPSGERFAFDESFLDGRRHHHDVHGPWLYLGPREHYRYQNMNDCLFNGEAGVNAVSCRESLETIFGGSPIYPVTNENPIWRHHGPWWGHWKQVCELFGEIYDIDPYILASQFIQAEGLRYYIETCRRRQQECAGLLMWQFNEPWPNAACTSVVDYFGRKKLGYWYCRNSFGSRLATLKYDSILAKPEQLLEAEVFLSIDHEPFNGTLKIESKSETGQSQGEEILDIQADAFSSPKVKKIQVPLDDSPGSLTFMELSLVDSDGSPVHWNQYVFGRMGEAPLRQLITSPVWKGYLDSICS
jgi:beta-mannosidase